MSNPTVRDQLIDQARRLGLAAAAQFNTAELRHLVEVQRDVVHTEALDVDQVRTTGATPGPIAGQVWECRDEVGRTGEQVRVTTLTADPGEETAVEFIVTRAARGYEAELGSDCSMEAMEFAQRYKLVN